jgi:hypothetical protein
VNRLFALMLGASLILLANDPLEHAKPALKPRRISVATVWDRSHHASAPDLVRFQDRWFVAFRESTTADSADGVIRIVSSQDGEKWSPWAMLDHAVADFANPHFQIMPAGKLLLTAAVTMHHGEKDRHRTYAWSSRDGRQWDGPEMIGESGYHLGHIEWQRGKAYTFGLQPGSPSESLRSFSSAGDLQLSPWNPTAGSPSEHGRVAVRFLTDESGIAISESSSGTAKLGVSRPPYRQWTWKDTAVSLHFPRLLHLSDGRLVASGSDSRGHSALFLVHPDDLSLEPIGALASGQAQGGTGLAWHDGSLWAAYAIIDSGVPTVSLVRIQLP